MRINSGLCPFSCPTPERGSAQLEVVAVGSREVSGITPVWAALLRPPGSCWGEEGGHDVRNPVQVRFAVFLLI